MPKITNACVRRIKELQDTSKYLLFGVNDKNVIKNVVPLYSSGGCIFFPKISQEELHVAMRELQKFKLRPGGLVYTTNPVAHVRRRFAGDILMHSGCHIDRLKIIFLSCRFQITAYWSGKYQIKTIVKPLQRITSRL